MNIKSVCLCQTDFQETLSLSGCFLERNLDMAAALLSNLLQVSGAKDQGGKASQVLHPVPAQEVGC